MPDYPVVSSSLPATPRPRLRVVPASVHQLSSTFTHPPLQAQHWKAAHVSEVAAPSHRCKLCTAPLCFTKNHLRLLKQNEPPSIQPRSPVLLDMQHWGHQLALLPQRRQGQQIGAPIPLTLLENICFHYHYYF